MLKDNIFLLSKVKKMAGAREVDSTIPCAYAIPDEMSIFLSSKRTGAINRYDLTTAVAAISRQLVKPRPSSKARFHTTRRFCLRH